MKRDRRILIFGLPVLIILAGLVIYDYVYLGLRAEKSAIRDEQTIKIKMLRKYSSLIINKPEYEKQLASLREQAKIQAVRLVPGDVVSVASANMQGIVKGIIIERGGTITSERIGKPEDLEKPKTVAGAPAPQSQLKLLKEKQAQPAQRLQILSVSIDATLPDVSALNEILYSIETRTPDLVVKEVDVRVRNFREPRELLVRIDVMGLYDGK